MLTMVEVKVNEVDQKKRDRIISVLDHSVSGQALLPKNSLLFMIGTWQTGDFGHIYAAIVSNLLSEHKKACAIIILQSGGGIQGILRDIEFALGSVCDRHHGNLVVFYTSNLKRDDGIKVISCVGKEVDPLHLHGARVYSPYEATFMASDIVKAMQAGQPMTPVWADLARDGNSPQSQAYAVAVEKFTEEYLKRFEISSGREKFVCLWSRTSGARTEQSPKGGANPQYDSSEESNHQLCEAIYRKIPTLKCIFIVGKDGFSAKTKGLPYVFDLGAFWTKLSGVLGRFQENGFFDYMTAVYDCDIVHVGMKSGGIDVLGLWGQKAVFVDTINSPEPTTARVSAWGNDKILVPVPVGELPTPTGKAIDEIRRKDGSDAIRTSVSSGAWGKIDELTKAKNLKDGFTLDGLEQIVAQVERLFN